ncbi:MAG: hypothetical protein OEM29_05555 [Thermoplasmata archaeon]|nr:hypothetical protein [Thermoplasmata archaeon]
MSAKLEDARAGLGICEEDMDRLRKATFRRKLLTRTFGLLMPLLSFVAGFATAGGLARPEVAPTSSYPYVAAASSMFNYKAFSAKTRFTIFGTTVASAIALIAGFVLGGASPEPEPSVTLYGVFDAGGTADAR